MYNEQDRNNYEYHYSYRPNYSEPIPTLEPVQPAKRHGIWKRVTAGGSVRGPAAGRVLRSRLGVSELALR